MPILDLPADPPLSGWPDRGRTAILDLEYTAWEGSAGREWREAWEWREIVQIGCLLVDASSGFAAGEGVELLVRPERNPALSGYFVALTGITQARLDAAAQPFPQAAARLAEFVRAADPIIFNGTDGQVLRENCAFHGIALRTGGQMLDFRPLLARTLGLAAHELVSSELPRLAGVAVEGRSHSALHDCRSIAAALGAWRRNGTL